MLMSKETRVRKADPRNPDSLEECMLSVVEDVLNGAVDCLMIYSQVTTNGVPEGQEQMIEKAIENIEGWFDLCGVSVEISQRPHKGTIKKHLFIAKVTGFKGEY